MKLILILRIYLVTVIDIIHIKFDKTELFLDLEELTKPATVNLCECGKCKCLDDAHSICCKHSKFSSRANGQNFIFLVTNLTSFQ